MSKYLVFDLDGVLRNLYPVIRRKYGLWSPSNYYDWDKKGYNIYELVEKDYSVLIKAKPTKYLEIIQEYVKSFGLIEIWSYQPQDWISSTEKWIKKYFPNYVSYWLKPKEKYKRLLKNKDIILIDDYPNHPNYNRIWLIDQPYNRNVKCKVRIKSVEDLRKKIKENWNE